MNISAALKYQQQHGSKLANDRVHDQSGKCHLLSWRRSFSEHILQGLVKFIVFICFFTLFLGRPVRV